MAIFVCKVCEDYARPSNMVDGVCKKCREAGRLETIEAQREREKQEREVRVKAQADALNVALSRITLTTETAHNLHVAERLDIVTAECVFGMHILKDIFGEVRDIFGGRSAAMQNTMREARRIVLTELRKEAMALQADAVVGVSLSYTEVNKAGSMLMVVATGTAVKLV